MIDAVILAAGKGTRLPSPRPKPLQNLLGSSMISLVYDALIASGKIARIHTVVGHGADLVSAHLKKHHSDAHCVLQAEQKGTGHAIACALAEIATPRPEGILVVNADMPLLTAEIFSGFLEKASACDIAFMTLDLEDPASYGRVLRDDAGNVAAIVEWKDFKKLFPGHVCTEINAGVYYFKTSLLAELLPQLSNDNASGEYYITDLVKMGIDGGRRVEAFCSGNDVSLLGVNTPRELAAAEEILRKRNEDRLLDNGVVLHAPELVRVGSSVTVEPGCEIYGPCELIGDTVIRSGTVIESHCVLIDTEIGNNCTLHQFCHFEGVRTASGCLLGPFARLRPGTVLEDDVHVGDFVEMKKSHVGRGSKANHLSYLGDAEIGEGVNIGAGCITCNYDGKNKFKTQIGDGAFLGSNCAFVAPVTIGEKALTAAGSVITQDVPAEGLAFGRARQTNKNRKKDA